MGTLLLGLAVGLAAGIVIGRRAAATNAAAAPTATPPQLSRIAPPRAGRVEVIAPNKRGMKVGLTEADFTPADDILERMQQAWEQGASLADLEAAQAAAAAAEAAAAPEPEEATEGLTQAELDERTRRVLERLAANAGRPDSVEGDDMQDEPGASTVTEALAELAADGYGDDLRFVGGAVVCGDCGTTHPTNDIEVDRVFRFEGPSDPADEAIVLGLRCPRCGAKGAIVSAFGPDADPALAEAFVYLADRARHH
jgi:hypothetical protein